jgi:hypothetical protein
MWSPATTLGDPVGNAVVADGDAVAARWGMGAGRRAARLRRRVDPARCHKHSASFADALAALRRTLWRQRITAMSANPALQAKITSTLIDVLAEAA